MSRSFFKLLAFALVAVFLFAVVTGCAPTAPVDTEATPTPEATPEPTPEPTPVEITKDLGGRSIKVAAWWDMTPVGGTPGGDRSVARRAEMEEKYNFTFEYVNVPWENTVETYSASVLAGDPFADIATIEDNWFVGLADKGFIQPVDELFNLNNEKWNTMIKDGTTMDGKIYGLLVGDYWPMGMVFFNKTLFERDGLPSLYELQNSKQWTWEKMLEIAKAATKDTDSDGVIDQWGLGGIDTDVALVYSNGAEMATMVDGKPVLNLRDPAVVEALDFFYQLANFDKVFFNKFTVEGGAWDVASTKFEEGKIAMFMYQYWKVDGYTTNMADDYGIVLPPMGPSNTTGEYKSLITGFNFQTIPSNVTSPEDIAFIWDMWTEPFPEDLEDPEAWKNAHIDHFRDTESMDTLRYMWDHPTGTLVGLFGSIKDTWWSGQDDLLKGEKTVAQIIDEKYDAMQTALNDIFAEQRMKDK